MRIPIILTLLFATSVIVAQQKSITFEVDMSYQIEQGKFNPQTEFVDIAGTFNNWGGTLNQLQDPENDNIWSVTLGDFTQGQNIEFKFRYNGNWDDREEFPGAGNNRTHTVGANDETLSFWYNDEEPPTGPAVAKIKSSSTFVFSGGTVVFSDDSDGLIENIEWVFEGAEPSTSTNSEVSVVYAKPGSYDVTLKVSNSFSSDEITLTDYISVGEQNDEDLEWWNESTFYEIFVRSFYDSDGDGIGDFNGITEKLDYLNDGDPNTKSDLGVTGIWLMPIHDSPSYHGYDVNDYRSINPDYGTMEDFKLFLEEAHKRGIKVIIDLVLNHTSTDIEWFKNSRSSTTSDKRNWYRWTDSRPSYSGPWGQTVWHGGGSPYYYGLFWGGMPDLNYEELEVKEEMYDITRFWLEDIGIDGFRLDAVKYIHEDDSNLEDLPETHAFWREWVAVTKQSKSSALSVGEAWTSTEKIVPYVVNEGLDFCFDFDLGSAMINSIKSGSSSPVRNQINKVINSYPYYQFGTFSTNHDQNRIMDEFGADEEKVKLIAATYLTLPGVPFIYYGEEVGMLGSKPDENIRRPFPWSNDSNGGFSSRSPWNALPGNYQSNNVEVQRADQSSLFNWYRRLVQLRNDHAALQKGTYSEVSANTEVLAFWREYEGDQVLVLVNYGEQDATITVDVSGVSTEDGTSALVDQLDVLYRIDIENKSEVQLSVGGGQARVFAPGSLTLSIEEQSEIAIYPNPTSDRIWLQGILSTTNFSISDLGGKVLIRGTYELQEGISIETLPKGAYILDLERDGSEVSRKFVKQ